MKLIKLSICMLFVFSLGCSMFDLDNIDILPDFQHRYPESDIGASTESDIDFASGDKSPNFKIPIIRINF